EKCGWPLLVNARFYKLEKIPAKPQAFWVIEDMQTPEDYVLLCCTMAFLEEQEIDGQFLLSDLCEALLSYYPQEDTVEELNWESYNWRKALIRIINYLLNIQVLRVVEDESDAFLHEGMSNGAVAGEALYEVSILSRCFLRSYPRDVKEYHSVEKLCAADFMGESAETADILRKKRNRVYRSLLLQPVYYRKAESEEDFVYLRNMVSRINDEINDFFDLELELYQDTAMAVSYERNTWFKDIFPYRMRGVHDIILQFSSVYREQPNWQKRKVLSLHEFRQFLEQLAERVSSGWTKEFREMGGKRLAHTVLDEMLSWGMASFEEEMELIELLPALFRISGKYPADYSTGGEKSGIK
ncbi:MAG: TIGR02678 family protein, partial [Selenomonadaceae bacterium]